MIPRTTASMEIIFKLEGSNSIGFPVGLESFKEKPKFPFAEKRLFWDFGVSVSVSDLESLRAALDRKSVV